MGVFPVPRRSQGPRVTLEWVSLGPVAVGQDGTYTLHVRNLVDGGDDYRRWPADAGSRELAVILGAND